MTQAVSQNGGWTFSSNAPAPYGAANDDVMYAHGGFVANAQALLNFAREYDLAGGAARPRWLFPLFDDTTRGGQNGLLWGTFADLHEFDDSDAEFGLTQGSGCLVPGDESDLDLLSVTPCLLPHGLTIAMLFNGDLRATSDDGYVVGRADMNVLKSGIRRALSTFATDPADRARAILLSSSLSHGCETVCDGKSPLCRVVDCGDGDLDPGEACDDGNNDDDDGCEHNCQPTSPDPQVPPSYAACEGRPLGECVGGPCAPRDLFGADFGDFVDPNSAWHPDGDISADTQCFDDYTGGGEAPEAVCRREIWGGKKVGVCRECGADTMVGCLCPSPNDEDGGCNGIAENGLSCMGGRCWPGLPPSWMCKADDTDIYSNSGYCRHDSPKGAVCYDALCSEPFDGWCDVVQGRVCDSAPNTCNNGSCCQPECPNGADCDARGDDGFVCNAQERCVP